MSVRPTWLGPMTGRRLGLMADGHLTVRGGQTPPHVEPCACPPRILTLRRHWNIMATSPSVMQRKRERLVSEIPTRSHNTRHAKGTHRDVRKLLH